jgi:hypothetical protein
MEQELQQAWVLVGQAQTKVEALERGLGSTTITEESVQAALNAVSAAMEGATASQKSTVTFRRLEGLKSECESLMSAVNRVKVKQNKVAQARAEREELMSSASARKKDDDLVGSDRHLVAEEDSLRKTQTRVRQMTKESGAVLEALRGQRQTMTKTQKSLTGILASMGVSDQIINQIERMDRTDRVIVLIGMLLLTVLMLYIWFR